MGMNKTKSAYDNDPEIAAQIRAQVQHHYDADEIIHGKYWEDGKGCAVGCIVHSSDHSKFDEIFGEGGEACAYLLDALFESIPNGTAKELPRRFSLAVKSGADMRMVVPQWIYWTLTENVKPTAYPQFQPFIDAVTAMYKEWGRTGVRPHYHAYLAYQTYRSHLASLASRAYLSDQAYRGYLSDVASLSDRADLAYQAGLASRAYLSDVADRGYRAYRAYRASRASRADLDSRADLASYCQIAADKFLELCVNAPLKAGVELAQ